MDGHKLKNQSVNEINASSEHKPLISVLVAVFNVESYLRECLDSILSQTLMDIEIILVDDCSTDDSGSICDEYAKKDKRIRVIHKSKNEGLLLARKTAALIAKGEYIVFVDSDDLLSRSDSLQIMYDAISSAKVDILQFSIEYFHPRGMIIPATDNHRRVYPGKHEGSINIIKALIGKGQNWNIWNKIYKTSVCKKTYQSIENIRLMTAEDVYTSFMIAFHARSFKGVQTFPLYRYRIDTGVRKRTHDELNLFKLRCQEKLIVGLLGKFLFLQDLTSIERSDYRRLLEIVSIHLLYNCLYQYERLSQDNKNTALDYMFRYYHSEPYFTIIHKKLNKKDFIPIDK